MDWRLIFGRPLSRSYWGLQAAFVSADFHRVNDSPDPVRQGRMVPPGGIHAPAGPASSRAGRSIAIFVLASLGSQA
jgi:hypothetical protein